DDRGMIPVAADHRLDVLDGEVFPRLVADVLPARYLLEDEQPQLVAGIEKMRRLRIVRRADEVALEFVLENQSIAALPACGHRLAHEGIGLMPVETTQLDVSPVQMETLRRKARFTQAYAGYTMIKTFRARAQFSAHLIDLWPI